MKKKTEEKRKNRRKKQTEEKHKKKTEEKNRRKKEKGKKEICHLLGHHGLNTTRNPLMGQDSGPQKPNRPTGS